MPRRQDVTSERRGPALGLAAPNVTTGRSVAC